jgi:hypothetical protein
VFWGSAAFMAATVVLALLTERRRGAARAPRMPVAVTR